MAASTSTIAGKDGTGATIAGGLIAQDKSGVGTGPFAVGHVIVDSQGTNIAAVKAASTAAAATDPAVVVCLSPNGLLPAGAALSSASTPTIEATDSPLSVAMTNFGAGDYEPVAASQTAQVLGATGATGDYIEGILVIPATTDPGLVTLLDNAISIPVFVGGTLTDVKPFYIPLGMKSVSGAWKVTTGVSVSCIGIGNFT